MGFTNCLVKHVVIGKIKLQEVYNRFASVLLNSVITFSQRCFIEWCFWRS